MDSVRADQLDHAGRLIAFLHPAPTATSMVEITALAPKRRVEKRYFSTAGEHEIACNYAVDMNRAGYSVFVNLNSRSAMTGFEHDVPYVTAIGLDLQHERTRVDEVERVLTAAGISPSAKSVSGHGVHHYFRVQPAEKYRAKIVWERLCKYTLSDRVHNLNRIFRLAGTVNWKTVPKWCFLTCMDASRVYTVEQIDMTLDRLGAPPARTPKDGIEVAVDPPNDWFDLRKLLSQGVLDIIETGEKNAYSAKQVTRSEADWLVVCELVRLGAKDELIEWVYERTNVGNLKYRDAGVRYLKRTIESARREIANPRDRVAAKAAYGGLIRVNGGAAGERSGQRRLRSRDK